MTLANDALKQALSYLAEEPDPSDEDAWGRSNERVLRDLDYPTLAAIAAELIALARKAADSPDTATHEERQAVAVLDMVLSRVPEGAETNYSTVLAITESWLDNAPGGLMDQGLSFVMPDEEIEFLLNGGDTSPLDCQHCGKSYLPAHWQMTTYCSLRCLRDASEERRTG